MSRLVGKDGSLRSVEELGELADTAANELTQELPHGGQEFRDTYGKDY